MRALLGLVLVVVILVAVGTFVLGWWGRAGGPHEVPAIGTAGHVDADRARAAGAAVGERTAVAANAAEAALSDGAITAKIKSKMALDDTVKAMDISVHTSGHVVTLTGTVRSLAERERAVQLARETADVTRVVDHLTVGR